VVHSVAEFFLDHVKDPADYKQLRHGANEMVRRWKRVAEIEGVGPSKKDTGPLLDDTPYDVPG